MKVWEKIMLYPIGLCYWIADSAKKTGNFIGRKAKPAIAMLVAVTMMLSLMPITAFAVSSDIIVGGANLGNGSTTVYYKNGDTSGNLTGTAEDYNAKLETVGGVATLTIKNLVVAKTADAGIKSYVSLNLVLEGASSIAEKDDDEYDCRGIFVNGDLTISGDGVLSVTAGDAAEDDSYGIYVNGNLTIKSGTINATGGTASGSSYGIYATNVLIHDGTVNATGGTAGSASDNVSCGIGGSYGVVICGGTVNATGGAASGSSYGIYAKSAVLIEDGTVNATGGTAGSAEGNVSCGISAWDGALISGGIVNATGGAAYSSYGIEICYEISGGTVVATGGDAVDDSFGITRGTSDTKFNGGVVVMRGGTVSDSTGSSNAYYSFGIDSISLDGTKLAGQVVGSAFKESSVAYDKDAAAVVLVPNDYTVQNTSITGTNHTIDTNTAVVTPGTGSNGVPLVITESGSTVTLNGDLVLINLLGEFFTPAFSVNGDTTVSGSGTLTAIGAANKDYSYGISGNCSLSVDGAKIVAIGGPASTNSYGIGASVNVNVSNNGSVIAIGGAMTNDDADSYGIGAYNLSVSGASEITAIGGAVRKSAFSYGIHAYYKASISGTAEVTAVGGTGGSKSASYGMSCPSTVDAASITVAGGTLNAVAGKTDGNSYGINNAAGTVEIGKSNAGGTVTAVGGAAATYSSGVYGGTVTVESGTLNTVGGISSSISSGIQLGKSLNVSGGTVTASGANSAIYGYGDNSTVNISGGTVTATGGEYGLHSSSGSLAGGSFTGGEAAVRRWDGVNALLASGYGYFAGETQLTPTDSDTTVGSAYQTVTVKEIPIPHIHHNCGVANCTDSTHNHSEVTEWVELTASDLSNGTLSLADGNSYYLGEDIAVTKTVTISGTIDLCLNGHVLSGSGNRISTVTIQKNAVLNLCDCGTEATHKITKGEQRWYLTDEGTDTIYGGVIVGGRGTMSDERGGGICITGGTLNMYAGSIIGGNVGKFGGGVFVTNSGDTNGSFTMYNGTIAGNYAYCYGAGVYVKNGTFRLIDGNITGNYAGLGGGGVYVISSSSVFNMSGGSIDSNKANNNGSAGVTVLDGLYNLSGGKVINNKHLWEAAGWGGIYIDGEFKLSGAPEISGNTSTYYDTGGNIFLCDDRVITIEAALSNTTPIGVVMENHTGVFTGGGENYQAKFYSEEGYNVVLDGAGNLMLAEHVHDYTYTVNTENAAQIIESCTCGHSKTATLEIDTSVSTVYNGSAIKALKVSYSDGWVGDKNAAISYSNNTNAGTASGSVTIGGLTVTKSFTITKKSAEAPAAPTAQNSITYGAELSEVGLTAGWTWADGNTIPTVNNSGYTAYYTPADVTNLDWTAVDGWNASAGRVERTVAVTVNKSAPTYTAPTGLTATYGDTLANVSLPSGWTWKTPSASVGNAGVNSFKAVFTPDDTDNYDTVEIDVIVTVGKADASYTTPTGLTATYGDTLADVSLPSGWTWKTPSASVGNVGINSFKAVYTPSDTDNFNAAEVDVSVTVGKANSSYTEPTAKELVYNGSAQTLVNAGSTTTGAMQYALGSITEPTGSWSATLPQGQNAGTYYIWYKVVGDDNHNDVAPACVAVTIAKKQIAKPAADNSTFTYNGSYQTYAMNGDPAFIIDNNVQKNAGSYTVTVTLQDTANYEWTDGTTAVLEYTFKIEQKEIDIGWDATMFLPYTGNSLLPKATATNLVDGDTCTLTTEVVETTEGAGVIPGEWTAKVTALSNNNYKLPASGVRVIVTFEIVNGYQNYAPVVSGTNETIDGKGDGKITGVDNTMEYRKEGETSYTAVSGSEVTGLHDGIYYVRYAAKTYYNPSPEAQLTIGAGRKLTVTVPQNQIGYTLITTTPELDYYGSIRVEFKLLPGYSMTENFEIYNGTEPIWQHFNQQTGILELTFVASDYDLTVAGVADISAPVAEIDIKNNKWTNFWNDITFGLFFNETQDVTITAADAGSGVNTIQYYLAGDELEIDEVRAITDWVDYNGTFKIDPNNRYVVYAKITDNAGNTLYINSDGIVLDNIAPTLEGIENGKTYYGDLTVIKSDEQFYDIKMVTLDGEPMGFAEGTYGLIPADNAEHIVVVQDHAGNTTTYTVTVMKNYTVTYKADGIVVGTQIVGHGKDATAPDIPEKEGYTQTAPTWDKESTNITADTEINAVYTINKYTVTYKADGEVVGSVTVEHSKDATAPAIPEKEGYTQTAPAWDKDGKNITADTEINAVYTINEYTITFKDENGVYKTLTVKHGEAVTMPEVPAKDGYAVTWDTTIEKATDNATVNAVYTKNAVSDNPQTGDNSNLWLWWILLIVSAFGITVICIEQKKRKAMR